MTDNFPENVGVNDESRIRYHAARRGFRVMHMRGLECTRRQETGAGPYSLRRWEVLQRF